MLARQPLRGSVHPDLVDDHAIAMISASEVPARTTSPTSLPMSACATGETPLRILTGTPAPSDQVRNGPRTGVAGEGGNGDVHPWRYWIANDPTVSPYRAHVPRRRSS